MQQGRILVRAAINLSGLRLGRTAWVDPNDQWMKDALAAGHIVPVVDENDADRAG